MIIRHGRCKIKGSAPANSQKLTNNQVKRYVSLNQKKYRKEYSLFIADGPHLVEAAVKSRWQIEKVVVKPETISEAERLKIPEQLIAILPASQFAKIAPSQTPQGILAIVAKRDYSIKLSQICKTFQRMVACDNISDPGNLGTIIRTAAAFNYDAVICIGDCAELYNPKTIRATQGTIFDIPVIEFINPGQFLQYFKNDFDIAVISNTAQTELQHAPALKKPILVMGGETKGISPEICANAKIGLRIEQSDNVDSLNVAVAAGIAMYQFATA